MTCFAHVLLLQLLLLSSGFDIHLSSLNKLKSSDGSFKRSGYISGPDVYTVKVYRAVLEQRVLKIRIIYSMSILHFVGDSFVPGTIDKKCMEGAKVLLRVDKKFIPIVAGSTLAIIDQKLRPMSK